jgi:hypothetical protein
LPRRSPDLLRAQIKAKLAIHSLGSIFAETVRALDGEAGVISFASTVEVRPPFTPDHGAIQKAIAETHFEVPEMNVYDAMAAAVERLKAQPPTCRKIMLTTGESQDTGRKANLRQVVHDAGEANISIYPVGPSSMASDYRSGVKNVVPKKILADRFSGFSNAAQVK